MNKYCPNCGNEILETSNFCEKCGFNINKFINATPHCNNSQTSIPQTTDIAGITAVICACFGYISLDYGYFLMLIFEVVSFIFTLKSLANMNGQFTWKTRTSSIISIILIVFGILPILHQI